MRVETIKINVVTDIAEAPGWIDVQRGYLRYAIERHEEATGQPADAEELLRQTVAQVDAYLGANGRFIVAKTAQGDLIGMVLFLRISDSKGEIKRLFVVPEARGLGVAKRLLDRLEAEARQMGLSTLYLDTTIGLQEAIALYRSRGFVDATHDPASVQDPEYVQHLIFMEKAL